MPRIHTLDMQRLTPLGQIIADYMRQQWPRLQTKAELAHLVGVRPSTIDNLLYSQHVPSSRTLNKIARATGIPATQLYGAAGSYLPVPIAPPPPPPMPHPEQRRPPRIAEQQSPYAALEEYSRSIQAFQLPDEVKRAMIDTMLDAMRSTPPANAAAGARSAPVEPPPPWDDHEAVSTLQLPAVPPARTASSEDAQEEAQPAGSCS